MSEWNGQLISDMSTQHLENTLRHLERLSRKKYGNNWKSFVALAYFDIEYELHQRNPVENFGTPR